MASRSASVPNDQNFGIKKIVDCKISENGQALYHVKWHMTWEPAENLVGCQHLVDEFWSWVHALKEAESAEPQTKKRKHADSESSQRLSLDAPLSGQPELPKSASMTVLPQNSDLQQTPTKPNPNPPQVQYTPPLAQLPVPFPMQSPQSSARPQLLVPVQFLQSPGQVQQFPHMLAHQQQRLGVPAASPHSMPGFTGSPSQFPNPSAVMSPGHDAAATPKKAKARGKGRGGSKETTPNKPGGMGTSVGLPLQPPLVKSEPGIKMESDDANPRKSSSSALRSVSNNVVSSSSPASSATSSLESFYDNWDNPYARVTFLCRLCNKEQQSKSRGNWKSHYESHMDIQPFGCYVCEKRFRLKGDLKRHITNVHKMEADEAQILRFESEVSVPEVAPNSDGWVNPYVEVAYLCRVCSKPLPGKARSNWKGHFESHSDVKPFGCYVCEKAFRLKGDLKRHIVNVHGQEPIEERILKLDERAPSDGGK